MELERDYQASAQRLQDAYRRALPPIRASANDLLAEIERIEAATGEAVRDVTGLNAYGRLTRQIEAELQDFAVIARDESARLAENGLGMGVNAALDAVGAQSGIAARVWMRPDPAALERLISTVNSDAMRANIARFGANAADDFAALMTTLTAQGKGGRFIARAVAGWTNVPLAWADNMARTTQNVSYRGANHAAMKANERLLDGWLWRAALDVRTCMSCISQHGRLHPVDEALNDHHRGRCAPVPVVRGSTWTQAVETGEAWYGRLPQGTQRRIAGDLLYTALREGDAGWSDLSKPYQDDVFGEMLRAASVRELVEARRYVSLDRLARNLPVNATRREQAAEIAADVRTA